MNRFLLPAAALIGIVATQSAWATGQTLNTTIGLSATVTTVCSLSATPMTFGEVQLGTFTNGTATLTVTCTGGGLYTVALDNGSNFSGSTRNIKSGSTLLTYGLFQDSSNSIAWNASGAGLVSGTGTASPQNITVFGQIPGSQTIVSGNGVAYTDTVTATISY
jgi:spore coat protein U-like protein